MSQTNNIRKQIRDAIGCTCAFNEKYDGKSWNLKYERYDDCECMHIIPKIIQTLISSLDKVPIRAVEQYDPFGEHELVALADIKDILTNKKGGRG